MSELAVIVNGAPGSGKSTLCSRLGDALGMPVVSKDAIKEALAETVRVTLPTRSLGALASDVLWSMVGQIEEPVIIDSFWLAGRDDQFFERGLSAAGVRCGVEVWWEAPVDTMRLRFTTRPRHFVHHDASRLEEWEGFARSATPISSFPTIRVNTLSVVDVDDLASDIRMAVGQPHDAFEAGFSSSPPR